MESIVNTLIPHAISAIEEKDRIKDGTKIKGIYESYLSQFGPMCVQLGLRSALAVYENKAQSGKGNRQYVLDLIFEVLKKANLTGNPTNSRDWVNSLLSIQNDIPFSTEQLILDASIALKRAIRTFSLTDDKQD